VLVGLEDDIHLYFLVAGHTKNACDGAFGHVKRKLLSSDVRTPAEMMRVVEESSSSTSCVPSRRVSWKKWKLLLQQYFTMPSGCKITKYHVFRFSSATPWRMHVKELSNSSREHTFDLKKRNVSLEAAKQNYACDIGSVFAHSITPLDLVTSQQHDTRQNYLKVNILDRYYKEDAELMREFFEDGCGEIPELP